LTGPFTKLEKAVARLEADLKKLKGQKTRGPVTKHDILQSQLEPYHILSAAQSANDLLGADSNGQHFSWTGTTNASVGAGDAGKVPLLDAGGKIDGSMIDEADGNFSIGSGAAGVDYELNFNGESNDGQMTWMEDEDYFLGDDYRLSNTQWDDLRFPVNVLRVPAAGGPTWRTYKVSFQVLGFAAASNEVVYATAQLPHNWKEGTDLYAHCHWLAPTNEASKVVRWGMAYHWANIGGTFGAASSNIYVNADTNNDADEHKLDGFAAISGSGKTFSSILNIILFRDGADAADTYTAEAYLLEFDIHYEVWRWGTDSATSD
jgi:hypothetical protein